MLEVVSQLRSNVTGLKLISVNVALMPGTGTYRCAYSFLTSHSGIVLATH